MSITSTAPKCSRLLRLLRTQNPNCRASFIHLATEKPSAHRLHKALPSSSPAPPPPPPSPVIAQLIEVLKSEDNGSSEENEKLVEILTSLGIHSLSSDQLLQITRRLPDSSTALNFLQHLRSNSPCPHDDSLSSVFEAVFELASREPNSGDKLLELFNTSKQLNLPLTVRSATLLIGCFGKGKMVDKLMLVFNELEPRQRDCDVRNILVDELLRNGCLDDALQVLDEMLQSNARFPANENTRRIVFDGLFNGQKYERRMSEKEIVELVSKFGAHGLFPDSIRLTKWITKFCRIGECDSAWDLLHVMMDLDGPLEVASFNALLTGLEKNGQFKKMNLLMKEMKDKGILPNVVTMGISINHLCKSRRVDEALELFEKMRAGEVGAPIEPDVIIHNTLIDGLCKVGRLEEGLALMRRMKSDNNCLPSPATYNCLIDGFCKAGELEKSVEFFHEMGKDGVQPNVITVNSLVDGMCKHGRAGSALEFFKEMKEKGLEGNAVSYTALIGGFFAVNKINKAMELFDEVREKFTPDAVVYYTAISGLTLAGRMDDAYLVFSEMRKAGIQPDIGCYNVMINGFCKTNKMDKALEMLKEMARAGMKPDNFTYNTLISYFSKNGDLKTAHKLLRQMLKDKIAPTVVTYGALIHAFCLGGELDEAMNIFWEMRSSTRIPPNTVIYNALITCLCERKRVKEALNLLDDMKLKDVSPNTTTFNAILKGLQEENRLEKAFELMDRMIEEACNPDYITLEILTEWLPGVGEADKLRKFVQGYKISDSTRSCYPQFYGQSNLSKYK